MFAKGTVIHPEYRVLERIAQGEIGEVYKSERTALGQLCVLKILNIELMSDPPLVERFKQEAESASRFLHPSAVQIEGVGEAADGRPFVAMEYLAGENLRQVMVREGRLPLWRACFIAGHVAAVLQAAHAAGIVHQDITPGNIMLVQTPAGERVRLLDCGIARLKEDRRRDMGRIILRRPSILMGTPEYFSPEMAAGNQAGKLDGRSDLYSLGVVFYQMLCGELPFEAKSSTMDVLLSHLLTPPRPISHLCPDLPEKLGGLVMRMLEKKPQSRPASAREVVERLAAAPYEMRQTSAAAPAVSSSSPPGEGETIGEVALADASPSFQTLPAHPIPPRAAAVSDRRPDQDQPNPAHSPQGPGTHPRSARIVKALRRWLPWAGGTMIAALPLI